ncbi:MAG: hypothetical protein QOE09_693 [Ilumatobacteraceae bacterium]
MLAEPGLPAQLYAAARQSRLLGLIAEGDSPDAGRRAVELAAAPAGRDDGSTAVALLALAAMAWRRGRVGDTLGLLRAATYADKEYSGEGIHCYPGLGLSIVLSALGEYDEADEYIMDAADGVAVRADALWAAAPTIFAARVALAAGRLDVATVAAQAGLELIGELDTPLFAPIAQDVLISVALSKGQLWAAADQLAHWQPDPAAVRLPFGSRRRHWSDLCVRRAQDCAIRNLGSTGSAFDLLASDNALLLEEPAAAAWLVRAARHIKDEWRAFAVVTTVERLAAVNPAYPTIVAAAAHARGVMEGDLDLLIAAATAHRSPWARASAAEDVGTLSAEGGDRIEARSWFEQAAEEYGKCGATRDLGRIRSRLRTLGVRARHWKAETRPVTGWDSLTQTERSVAALVAEGLSNQRVGERMFLSRHTVDFHLRHIFRKLGIDSRVVLTRLALTREVVAT